MTALSLCSQRCFCSMTSPTRPPSTTSRSGSPFPACRLRAPGWGGPAWGPQHHLPPPGLAGRDPGARPARRGAHAAGQQGERSAQTRQRGGRGSRGLASPAPLCPAQVDSAHERVVKREDGEKLAKVSEVRAGQGRGAGQAERPGRPPGHRPLFAGVRAALHGDQRQDRPQRGLGLQGHCQVSAGGPTTPRQGLPPRAALQRAHPRCPGS